MFLTIKITTTVSYLKGAVKTYTLEQGLKKSEVVNKMITMDDMGRWVESIKIKHHNIYYTYEYSLINNKLGLIIYYNGTKYGPEDGDLHHHKAPYPQLKYDNM